MQENIKHNSLSEFKFNYAFCYRILLLLVWTKDTVLSYAAQVIRRIPIIGVGYEYFVPFVISIMIILSLPYFLKYVKSSDVVFYLVCILFLFGTFLIFPKNSDYLLESLARILLTVIPMYFLGIVYNHESLKKDLFYASLLGVACMLLYQLYYLGTGRVASDDDMEAAYFLLPSVMYIEYWAFSEKKVIYWLLFLVSFFAILIYGTRGPVLAILIYFLFGFFVYLVHAKLYVKLIFSFIFVIGISIIVFSPNLIIYCLTEFSDFFESIGFSTRIFDKLLEGTISAGSGRNLLAEKVFQAIIENPIIGLGIMGDRVILDIYVHNIVLECWCHYGIILGSILLILLCCFVIKSIIKSRNTSVFMFLFMMCSFVFTKLMLSGSYLFEPYLFFLWGIVININRYDRRILINNKNLKSVSYENCSN